MGWYVYDNNKIIAYLVAKKRVCKMGDMFITLLISMWLLNIDLIR